MRQFITHVFHYMQCPNIYKIPSSYHFQHALVNSRSQKTKNLFYQCFFFHVCFSCICLTKMCNCYFKLLVQGGALPSNKKLGCLCKWLQVQQLSHNPNTTNHSAAPLKYKSSHNIIPYIYAFDVSSLPIRIFYGT